MSSSRALSGISQQMPLTRCASSGWRTTMQTKQARSFNPGTTPAKTIANEFPNCPDGGGKCTWGWSGKLGKHYVRYINAACLAHGQVEAILNGQAIHQAA